MQSQNNPQKRVVPVACGQLSRGLYARIFRRCDVVLWTHFSAITQMIRQLVVFHINTSATQQTNFNSLWVRGESELTARVFGDPAPSARTLPVRILFLLTESPRRPHWEQYCHDSETERSSSARVAHRQHIFVRLKPALRFFRNCESIDRLPPAKARAQIPQFTNIPPAPPTATLYQLLNPNHSYYINV